jgi:thioredoxin 1
VNVDESPVAAGRFGVLSLPTVILFAGGEARATVVGARPRGDFDRLVSGS